MITLNVSLKNGRLVKFNSNEDFDLNAKSLLNHLTFHFGSEMEICWFECDNKLSSGLKDTLVMGNNIDKLNLFFNLHKVQDSMHDALNAFIENGLYSWDIQYIVDEFKARYIGHFTSIDDVISNLIDKYKFNPERFGDDAAFKTFFRNMYSVNVDDYWFTRPQFNLPAKSMVNYNPIAYGDIEYVIVTFIGEDNVVYNEVIKLSYIDIDDSTNTWCYMEELHDGLLGEVYGKLNNDGSPNFENAEVRLYDATIEDYSDESIVADNLKVLAVHTFTEHQYKKYLSDDVEEIAPIKKYELVEDDKIIYNKKTLYRIKALRDFGDDVKKGDLGGYVESEKNLSHCGYCWLYGNSKALDNSRVIVNACLRENAVAQGNSVICGSSTITNYAKITDNSRIGRYSLIGGNTYVCGNTQILCNINLITSLRLSGYCTINNKEDIIVVKMPDDEILNRDVAYSYVNKLWYGRDLLMSGVTTEYLIDEYVKGRSNEYILTKIIRGIAG